jgi:molybdate transport system substrate-binding protein
MLGRVPRLGPQSRSVLLGLVLWLAAMPANAQELLVFGAASLREALDAVIEAYQAQGGGEVRTSYASSSTLARQIEQGAPADIYISANPQWMDYLEEHDLVREGSRADLLGNGLVLVAPQDSGIALEIAPGFDLLGALDGGLLAMGDPDHVPAGIYGQAALASLGVWDGVAAQVARADNVRAALALVSRGETPLGVVYRSDAVADRSVKVIDDFPQDSYPPIVYPVAIMADSKNPEAAALLAMLKSDTAAEIFERFGFTMLR